ncbi:siderophore-interacting protein [Aeromicrobium phragmitis]|uniref:Siderophore-interacting protein n=1 Tax=Aeromicrobium phragmitis TaxID=2478914 RepID=A0A3L8PTC3_9ACTN|nr:siderophore-interacting protein [Aeromicrobium phragmitis]RLV57262.1 siderophore-interacting protein [Aeromicrobium phragmitis]
MSSYRAIVRNRRQLTSHLVTVTLGGLDGWTSTGIPDEYVRVFIPQPGTELVLPEVGEKPGWTFPEGVVAPQPRVYTISDHRIVDGDVQVDLDIALHDVGIGSDWARTCEPGDEVAMIDPHGLYKPSATARHQLLVCDITGLPALARILRGLDEDHRVEAHIVLTDDADRIALPSAADVSVTWDVVADETRIGDALRRAVCDRDLPASAADAGLYVWFAGEAAASRAVRKRLRRELGWPQSDFYTCGYWQFDAEAWNARYAEVAEAVTAEAIAAYERANGDDGVYLDELEKIYERVGL